MAGERFIWKKLGFSVFLIISLKTSLYVMSHKFNVLFQKDENGYFAFCPELKGCHSQGDTFEEAQENIREAIELYVESMSKEEVSELLPSKNLITTTMEVEIA